MWRPGMRQRRHVLLELTTPWLQCLGRLGGVGGCRDHAVCVGSAARFLRFIRCHQRHHRARRCRVDHREALFLLSPVGPVPALPGSRSAIALTVRSPFYFSEFRVWLWRPAALPSPCCVLFLVFFCRRAWQAPGVLAGYSRRLSAESAVLVDPFQPVAVDRGVAVVRRSPAAVQEVGAFPISRSRAHTHRRHGHPLQTVPSAGLIERPQEKNRVDALR